MVDKVLAAQEELTAALDEMEKVQGAVSQRTAAAAKEMSREQLESELAFLIDLQVQSKAAQTLHASIDLKGSDAPAKILDVAERVRKITQGFLSLSY